MDEDVREMEYIFTLALAAVSIMLGIVYRKTNDKKISRLYFIASVFLVLCLVVLFILE